jgi:hypothetical protein
MTPPPKDTGIDNHNQLFFFESSAHDQTIASWLAQYTYVTNNLNAAGDNDRRPPSALISTFCLGPVQESLGITIPIVWMANLACNFQSEFTDSDDLDDNNNNQETVRTYRQFTMEEQQRFDALQLTYLTEKIEHSIDLEYCGTRQFHLSPRMIISSKAERSKMIEVLSRYLEVRTKVEERDKKKLINRAIIVDSSSDTKRENEGKDYDDDDDDQMLVINGMGKKKTKGKNRRRKLKRQQQAKERELSSMIRSFDNNNINEPSNDDEEDDDNVETNWCCDYCGVAMFSTYEDACQHEKYCSVYLKLMDKDGSQDAEAVVITTAKEEEAQMEQQEKKLCESSTTVPDHLAVMRSATIDYEDRVNDTALPRPNEDVEANSLSIPVDKIDKLSSSPIQPILLYNVHAAKTADEVSLLQRVTNITRENELLIDENNLLIKQNKALAEKLVETKRQSIEAVQQVHLKAYIAETARTAAEERILQLIGMVSDYITDKVADDVIRQEMLGAVASFASKQMTPPRQSGMPSQCASVNELYPSPTSNPRKQALYTDSTTNADILTPSSPGQSFLFRLRRGDHAP